MHCILFVKRVKYDYSWFAAIIVKYILFIQFGEKKHVNTEAEWSVCVHSLFGMREAFQQSIIHAAQDYFFVTGSSDVHQMLKGLVPSVRDVVIRGVNVW